MPDGAPRVIAPERREEFSPGLDPELLALEQAGAEMEVRKASNGWGRLSRPTVAARRCGR